MKNVVPALRPIAILGTGLLLALAGAALGRAPLAVQDPSAAALSMQITGTPTLQEVSEIGSTDGIMLMSIVIVVIVVVPILLRRLSWAK